MELNALKSVMKDMGIRYEKFHTRNTKTSPKSENKTAPKKEIRPGNFKNKPKTDL